MSKPKRAARPKPDPLCPFDKQPVWRHVTGTTKYYDADNVLRSHPKKGGKLSDHQA